MSAPTGNGKVSGRELKANPFGNYSLKEAQQPTGGSSGVHAPNESRPAPTRNTPFSNYSFKEAQQQVQPAPPAVEPSSPTVSISNSRPFADYARSEAESRSLAESQQPFLRSTQSTDDLGGEYQPAPALPESYDSYDGMGATQMGHGGTSIEQYAIRMLYEEFRDRAARKIDDVIELRLDREPDLAKHLELGADVIFDRTLEKLGMLARRRPRVIIELLLVWRKTTIDATDEYPLEGTGGPNMADGSRPQQHLPPAPAALSRAHYIVKERKSLASVYILCRALSAVVEQLEASHLEGDLGDRLEELVFGQVKQVNPANLRRSQNRRQIQDLYARLIGQISDIRFASMSDRFIAELERIPMVSSGSDERIVVLLHNMRFLRLRVFPIDALEEGSAFLLSCAKFYSRTSGSLRLKHAWATLLTELLMPMAAVVDVEVNLPELVQALDIIFAKAMKMAPKVRHVHVAFPLAAATLCISRRDVFHQRWLSLLEYCIQRLKDKQFRRVSMDAILRMLWVYLFRYPEASAVVTRRIDSLSRIFFPATKLHAWPKTVPPSAFVYFLVCAACYNFDFAMRQLLLNMLQTDSGWPGTTRELTEIGPVLDSLNPARVGLAYQALVALAAIASSRASLGTASGGGGGGGGADGGGGSGQSSNADTANGSSACMHPPFPGVAQLSGLDYFSLDSQLRPGSHVPGTGGGASGLAPAGGAAGHATLNPTRAKISLAALPDNIRNALATATSVVQRYFNALNPIFGQYVLADDRLWRLTRTMPPFSSVVMAGSTFTFENTATYSSLALQGAGSSSISSGGAAGLGVPNGGESAGGMTGGGGASGGPAAHAAASISENMPEGRFHDGASGNVAPLLGGTAEAQMADASGGDGTYAMVPSIRQAVARYPSERQVYVDLMAVYTCNIPKAQMLWGHCDRSKIVETMVQNMLSVDQALAAASRACLLDLLCPSSLDSAAARQWRDGERMFGSRAERLDGAAQAVVRATQLLRAVDERFSEILVGGIFSRDARSSMSFVQPGDPLVDGPGAWPYSQQPHSHQYCSRRFMHAANLSSASTASNHNNVGNDVVGRGLGGTVSDSEEPYVRHAYSTSAGQANDPCDSDTDAGSSAAAATAAMAAALDVKARMERSAWSSSASGPSSSLLSVDAAARELNGGYLHAFLDLMHYLEVSLCEYQAEEDAATNAASSAASGGALADQAGTAMASAAGSSSSLPEGEAGNGSTADEGAVGGGGGAAADTRAVGGRSLVDWVKLVNAIEANAVALLCSSSARVRHLAVDILYQAGVLRRILGASEPLPSAGQAWAFRGVDSAYEILNVMVPLRAPAGKIAALGGGGALIGELWDVPFDGVEASGTQQQQQSQQQSQPLARLAASSAAADVALWMAYLPQFVGRASVLMPEVMLVSRTLVCQRLYQMQPLMSQYAEVSVRAGGLQHGTLYVRASGVGRTHAAGTSSSSSSSVALRADLISAFNSLFLFAVVSLPACGGLSGGGLGGSGGGGSGALLGETVVGSRSPRNGGVGGSNSGAFSNSRLAKSIARKLAPLKASSRGSKQEHGVGLASISQLVRMAGVLLRSDNAPLRQSAALALCHTPAAYLVELMLELRPLAESLFDDGSSLGSHRHYLHVSGASSSTAGGGGSGGRDGLLGALGHHGPSSSPGSSAMSASGGSPKPQAAQQVYRTGSTLLAAAQLAPHGSSKRRSNRAAAAAAVAAASQAASAALGSDTEATSDSGNNNNNSSSGNGVQGRRASSFDATTMARGSSAAGAGLRRPLEASATFSNSSSGGGATSSANAAANAAAIAAVSGGSGSASQMRRKRLRLSLAQIYRQVSRQLSADSDEQVLGQLIAYVRETKTFLSEPSVQWEAEHQALRTHFCGLVEALYYCISSAALADSVKLKFTCETRNGLYQLFERWCGLGRHASAGHETRARMTAAVLDQVKDPAERALAAEALEGEFRLLELASLRGMAVLCRDAAHFHLALPPPPPPLALALAPAAAAESSGPRDKAALFAWVSDALDHHDARVQRIGQRAVEWAVGADARDAAMVRVVVQMSYGLSVASSVSNGFVEDAGLVDRAAGAASAAASGLGLMFSSSSHHKQQPPQSSEALATDRVALGHLRALTSIMGVVAPPPHAPSPPAPLLPGVLLPLALFRLRSERHRMRRQALVLLRVLCAQASKRECQARLDELAPSIVSDIPAVAADAAARLAAAVAAAFSSHSQAAILECVRQVHAQAALGGRLEALLAILRPWVANVRLRRVVETVAYTASASARPCHVENDVFADCDGLGPVALSRDSLVVLRCMLYLTVKAGLEAMPGIEGLWLALVGGGGGGESNTWLVMRYLTGLLLHTQSLALLGFMRRIAVFLTRQSAAEAEAQGRQLVRRLVDEARRPGAATPIEAASTVAHNAANEALPGEAWTTEFVFAPRRATRVLVSTAGLSMFYLAAVSYEQPAVVVDYGDLAVLAPAVFALANPERWVRDAARTVLVNLVTAERAWCGSAGLSDTVAADAAHAVLSVLRGDECATGFGNVSNKDEDSEEHKRKPGRSPDDDYALDHAWSPMAAANVPDLASGEGEDDAPKDCGGDPPAIDVADPSAVADVADTSLPLRPPPPPPPSFPQRRSLSIDYHLDAGGGAGSNSNSSGGGGGPGRERATLQRFVVQLSRLFCRRRPGCAQEWAGVAVRWAMSCPVRPLAALALQVFSVLAAEAQHGGALVIMPTRSMILHLIDRLSNVVGDPSDELAAFAETVLAALRQTAALAARMCAEDEDIRADLLAASVVLMATAQSAPVYAMAVAVFERIFPLVEAHEQYFRRLVADRIGGGGGEPLNDTTTLMFGFQLALLRGLEFASCRERCLRLLRDTLKYDMAAASSGCCAHPMLAIVAHLPALIEDVVADVAFSQGAHLQDSSSSSSQQQLKESQGGEECDNPVASSRGRRHGARKNRAPPPHPPSAPTFSTSAPPGSSLGLMFASAPAVVPNLLYSNSAASRGGPTQQQNPLLSSPRRQLFRRRGANNSNSNLADTTTDLAVELSPEPAAGNASRESLLSQGADAVKVSVSSSLIGGRASGSAASQHGLDESGMLLVRDKHFSFISECAQTLLVLQQQQQQRSQETRLFVQRLSALLAAAAAAHPSSSASSSSLPLDGGVPSLQHTVGATREVVKQFGYAAVESGHAVDIVAVLLRLLQPSGRTRVALKYLRDEQAAGIVDGGGNRSHFQQQQRRGLATAEEEEVRKIDVAMRLLQSVLVASSDSAGGARAHTLLRLDSALMPSLRHLFDLLIVARPISDTASQVLLLLLQRFDDPSGADSGGGSQQGVHSLVHPPLLPPPPPAACSSFSFLSLLSSRWYETDSHLLHDSARAALSRIVALGIRDSSAAADSLSGDEMVGGGHDGDDLPLGLSRSVSPEMPVLVIEDRSLDDDDGRYAEFGDGGESNCAGGDVFLNAGSRLADVAGGPGDSLTLEDEDMLAQLDLFDKELDEALCA